LTTPPIQVTCDGTDPPIRHTTSLDGIAPDDELLLEPHPAMAAPAITAAAPNTAADLVKVTDRSPFPAVCTELTSSGRTPPAGLRPGGGTYARCRT
jgi:hypothetical protein